MAACSSSTEPVSEWPDLAATISSGFERAAQRSAGRYQILPIMVIVVYRRVSAP